MKNIIKISRKRADKVKGEKAILLKADGTRAIAQPAGKKFTDAELEKLVGRMPDKLEANNPAFFLVFSARRFQNLPFNKEGSGLSKYGAVYGDILYCPKNLV